MSVRLLLIVVCASACGFSAIDMYSRFSVSRRERLEIAHRHLNALHTWAQLLANYESNDFRCEKLAVGVFDAEPHSGRTGFDVQPGGFFFIFRPASDAPDPRSENSPKPEAIAMLHARIAYEQRRFDLWTAAAEKPWSRVPFDPPRPPVIVRGNEPEPY